MKVLLIWPRARKQLSKAEPLGWGTEGAIAEPLALEYLAAGARLDGHEVQILDLRLHVGDLDYSILEFKPDIVGVTGYSMHVLAALDVCQRIKALSPDCKTIVGGHHATLMPKDFFEPQIDYVVCGEGVAPFRKLLRQLDHAGSVHDIPGLWVRDDDEHDNEYHWGGDQDDFDVNSLPVPDRSATAADRPDYFIDELKPVALIRTTVGCPYRCSFCSLWRIMSGRYHIRDNQSVVDELSNIDEEWVFLVDDEAFINGKRMQALAELVSASGINKNYFAYCRIDTLLKHREVLAFWRKIGLRRLFIGIEAITEEMQLEFNKKLELADIEKALKLARELDIDVMGQFIIPTSASRTDFKRMARFVEHHRIRYPSFTILTPIPGTDMLQTFDKVIEKQANGRPNWDLFDCQSPVTETRLPKQEFLQEYQDLQRVFGSRYVNYWKPDTDGKVRGGLT